MALAPIIDSHAHLDYPQLAEDLDGVLARAKEAGVSHIISIGVKLSTAERPRAIAERYEQVYFSVGVHPHEADSEALACDEAALLAAADHPKCVAIGEAGLDYFYDHGQPASQAASLRAQISVARQLNLPIIIHARDADEDMAAILEDEYQKGAYRGVLHCFSSGPDLAWRALDIGFYISFSGILTFKKSTELQELAQKLPADRLLVETDAPFLAPHPHRGKPNEPAYTRLTLQKLAALRGVSEAEMAAQTYENTLRLFDKIKGAS